MPPSAFIHDVSYHPSTLTYEDLGDTQHKLNLLVSWNYLVFRLSLDQNKHCYSLVRQYDVRWPYYGSFVFSAVLTFHASIFQRGIGEGLLRGGGGVDGGTRR